MSGDFISELRTYMHHLRLTLLVLRGSFLCAVMLYLWIVSTKSMWLCLHLTSDSALSVSACISVLRRPNVKIPSYSASATE